MPTSKAVWRTKQPGARLEAELAAGLIAMRSKTAVARRQHAAASSSFSRERYLMLFGPSLTRPAVSANVRRGCGGCLIEITCPIGPFAG